MPQQAAAIVVLLLLIARTGWSAEGLRVAPWGAPEGAPPEYSRFNSAELARGFLKLAFGSDLQKLGIDDRIVKFDHRVRFRISNNGMIDRSETYKRVVDNFVLKVPGLDATFADEATPPDVIVRLVETRDFNRALAATLGSNTASEFINQTNPRCTTRLRASEGGTILRADVFIVVDQGTSTFLDCAYHETMHAFGLMNHGDDIPWTTLNQKRTVGYLSIYDQTMLRILYNPSIRAGMRRPEVEELLPKLLGNLEQ